MSRLSDIQRNWQAKGAVRKPTSLKDRVFPCVYRGCKVLRSADEGGTIFTVCDGHWDAAREGSATK